jgi:hypothetical protein
MAIFHMLCPSRWFVHKKCCRLVDRQTLQLSIIKRLILLGFPLEIHYPVLFLNAVVYDF